MQESNYEPLDKETALRHIETVELKKAAKMAAKVVAQKMGQLSPQEVPYIAQIAKLKALDELEDEHRIREVDISIAVNMHELDNKAPEMRAIRERAEKIVHDHALQAMEETEEQ